MKHLTLKKIGAVLLSFALIASAPIFAAEPKKDAAQGQDKNQAIESAQSQVEEKATGKAAEKRKQIVADAVTAVNETKNALKLLDENKTDEALEALEEAIGKLELILAREPELALAPIDVEVIAHDLIADLDTIKETIEQAEEYLEDGEIQKARPLVASLASEIVLKTVNVPLATYPDAIKNVTPSIDEGKLDEAKTALQAALNTLVVKTEEVLPLPIHRAKHLLKNAEKLAENNQRTDKENETLNKLLSSARYQLKMAQLLGYGTKKSFEPMYQQLDQIEQKTSGGKSGQGWFDKLKQQISDLIE